MTDAEDKSAIMRPQDFFDSPKESKIIEEAKLSVSESEKQDILDEVQLRN